jgi:hypothetical protein
MALDMHQYQPISQLLLVEYQACLPAELSVDKWMALL